MDVKRIKRLQNNEEFKANIIFEDEGKIIFHCEEKQDIKEKEKIKIEEKEIEIKKIKKEQNKYTIYIKEERRREKRIPTDNEPVCLIITKGKVYYANIIDFSKSGLKITSEQEIKRKKIFIYTNFKNITFSGQQGKIVWKKENANGLYEYGLEIVT